MPVRDVKPADLHQSFEEQRRGHLHEAIDIVAPRGTPVVAVEEGRIARLFFSQAGGHTIYQFDPTDRYTYYYAHLDKYADALKEGDFVRSGQVIGYVGTSGNAPESTPHLHFAIFELGPEKRWWQGVPIDPFLVWR
jgi:murein DD-endopeptidase MepM/ murein hydrolase activator NlpD